MPLTTCPECDRRVSVSAHTCPGCGAELPTGWNDRMAMIGAAAVAVTGVVIGLWPTQEAWRHFGWLLLLLGLLMYGVMRLISRR